MTEAVSNPKRIDVIDALRGFALLGVVIVNAAAMNSPYWMDEASDFGFQKTLLDEWLTKFVFFFFAEKFYTIFALLFGFSAAIFFLNAQRNNFNPRLLQFKRMLGLALFGISHVVLGWWGDILIIYALLGLILIPFLYMSGKHLLWTGCAVLLVAFCLSLMVALQAIEVDLPTDLQLLYATGGIWQITRERLSNYCDLNFCDFFADQASFFIFSAYYLRILALFLFGAAAMKLKVVNAIEANPAWALVCCCCFFVIGVLQNLLIDNSDFWFDALAPVRGFGLSLCYMFGLVILFNLYKNNLIMRALQSVGRMTFSGYLLFSFIMTFVLYSYGFGLYGSIGPTIAVIIGMVYFIFFSFIASYWLVHFRQGPLEKLWRAITY